MRRHARNMIDSSSAVPTVSDLGSPYRSLEYRGVDGNMAVLVVVDPRHLELVYHVWKSTLVAHRAAQRSAFRNQDVRLPLAECLACYRISLRQLSFQ